MRWMLVWMLLVAAVHGEEERIDSTVPQPEWSNDSLVKIRLSGGVGAGTFGFATEGRILVGPRHSSLRMGGQALRMQPILSSDEEVILWSGIVGWEFSEIEFLSIMPFAGGGLAECHVQREVDKAGSWFDSPEIERSLEPALVTGIDFGLSFGRNLGLSLQMGGLYTKITSAYAVVQVDLGVW